MAPLSFLTALLPLLFSICVSANIVPRYALTTTAVASATYTGAIVQPSSFSGSCPQIDGQRYASPYGVYLVECYLDRPGSDVRGDGGVTASYQVCLDQCASTSACVAATWMSKSGKCYLHKALAAPSANTGAWGARWISGPLPPIPVSSSTPIPTSTPQAPVSTSTPSSSTTPLGPSSVSGGIESTFATPTYIPGPPPVILGPISPPGLDRTSLAVLSPQKVAGLFYSGGSNSSDSTTTTGTVAKLSVTLQYLSVALDNSAFVTTTCLNSILTATFSTQAAFAQAQNTWPGGTFILITAASTCSADGQNVFFQTSSVVFNTGARTATVSGAFVKLENVFSDMGLDFGAIPSGNSSSSVPTTDNNCGTPGNSTIDGLPAVACGSNFDQTLDSYLGFYPGDDADVDSVLAIIAPGSSTNLQKRFSLKSIVKSVVSTAKAVVAVVAPYVAPIIAPVVKAAQQAVAVVATVVTAAVTAVESFLTGTFSKSLNIPINITPPASMLLDSPWGPQFKFYDYQLGSTDPKYTASDAALEIVQADLIGAPNPNPGIEMFCVNCGVTGNIQVTGSVSISAAQGFYAGTIGMNGNLEAGLFVGINGFYEWQKELTTTILSAGLPGFSIPNVVTIGPELKLEISATLTVDAVGQILVGTSYNWPALSATLDVMNKANSVRSGFSPTVNRQFDAYGDITATASLGLPVTLSFGIDFFSGKWSKSVDLKDVPSLNAVAEFSVTGNLDTSTGFNGTGTSTGLSIVTNGCEGISWNVNLANEVDLDLGDSIEYTLWQWQGPTLAQGCIGKIVTSSSSSSMSSSSSTRTSTTSVQTSSSTTSLTTSKAASSLVLYLSSLTASTTSTQPTSTGASSLVLYLSSLTASSTSIQPTSTAASSVVLYLSSMTTSASSTSTLPTSTGVSSVVLYLSASSTSSVPSVPTASLSSTVLYLSASSSSSVPLVPTASSTSTVLFLSASSTPSTSSVSSSSRVLYTSASSNLSITSSSPSSSSTALSGVSSATTTNSASACTATSVIVNGGFENSTTNILPWTLVSDGAGPMIETYMPHSGSLSVMAYHGAGSPAYSLSQTVNICADTPYLFTFWAHTDGEPSATPCELDVCFGTDCASAGSIVQQNTTWASYSRNFAGGAGGAMNVSISTPSCRLFVLYDDVSFIAQTAVTSSSAPTYTTPVSSQSSGGWTSLQIPITVSTSTTSGIFSGSTSSASIPSGTTSGSSSSSTSSASIPSSTASLTINDTIVCPDNDGRNFTDAQGYVYKLQCGIDLPLDSMGSAITATSFEQCIESCFGQQNNDCVAVVYNPALTKNCDFKQDRNTLPVSTPSTGVNSAVLVSAPPCGSLNGTAGISGQASEGEYCLSNGEMFKVSYLIAYMANQLGSFNLQTLPECIDACSSGWPGVCNGVTFFPAQWKDPSKKGFPTTNCYPFSEGDNPVTYADAAGGVSALSRNARNQGYGVWKRSSEPASVLLKSRQLDTANNVTYATVTDTTNTLSLLTADDGNLYINLANATQAANTTADSFAFYDNTLFGDAQERYLHYYPSSIAAVGASRLRLAPWGSIPMTAALINLAPITAGNTTILIAVDTLGNYFWLYVCAIENQQNKVFLVNDPTNGAGILQDPNLRFTVTGGLVNDCAVLALTPSGVPGFGS